MLDCIQGVYLDALFGFRRLAISYYSDDISWRLETQFAPPVEVFSALTIYYHSKENEYYLDGMNQIRNNGQEIIQI